VPKIRAASSAKPAKTLKSGLGDGLRLLELVRDRPEAGLRCKIEGNFATFSFRSMAFRENFGPENQTFAARRGGTIARA
jgi:hypothetical protein